MCNRYEYDLAEWEIRELVEHYKLTGHSLREPTEVFANGPGMVVVDRGDERALERMLWGLSSWTEGRWLINFRNPEFEPWKSLIENKARRSPTRPNPEGLALFGLGASDEVR
jgi:putative SOS response-associated peptidase YedK